MKAIILGAGQGKRLLPATAELPKAMLPIGNERLAAWQVRALRSAGVSEFVFVSGFQSPLVGDFLNGLAARFPDCDFHNVLNPFFAVSDNLASCWMAREQMTGDFFLVNGDTLFQAGLARQLLASPAAPITVAVDQKQHYDEDDMKVRRDGTRLRAIGKDLPSEEVNAESIGVLLFRGEGPQLFRAALDRTIIQPSALRRWFLSVIGEIAKSEEVETCLISGHPWCEVDYPLDLQRARQMMASVREDELGEPSTASAI